MHAPLSSRFPSCSKQPSCGIQFLGPSKAHRRASVASNSRTYNLVSQQTAKDLQCEIIPQRRTLDLDGTKLDTIGKISVRWRLEGFREVEQCSFLVVAEPNVPFDVVLSAELARGHDLLPQGSWLSRLVSWIYRRCFGRARESQRSRPHGRVIDDQKPQCSDGRIAEEGTSNTSADDVSIGRRDTDAMSNESQHTNQEKMPSFMDNPSHGT